MTTSYFKGANWSLDVRSNPIEVTSEHPTPDERWRAIDSNGHEHFYDHGYPTLDLVVDASHWCDGNEGIARHDPHKQIDASHWECLICRETVEPRMHPAYWPQFIAGPVDGILQGSPSPGITITMVPTAEEITRIRTADDQDAVVQDILASVPPERMLLHEWTSV